MDKKANYRHGDVILIRLDKRHRGRGKPKPPVLALGEVTGHSHRLSPKDAALFAEGFSDEIYEELSRKMKGFTPRQVRELEPRHLKVLKDGAELTHEEHGAIAMPKADFAVLIQRDHEPGGWKRVED